MVDTDPFGLIQLHAMPKTGNPANPKVTFEYVAGQPIEGFVPRKIARRDLYGYMLPTSSGNAVDRTVAVTSGTRTETLGFSKSSGGIVLEWTTVDTGINVQWLNHRGACTRGLQTKWLVTDDVGARNLTQGGSASEGDGDAASVQVLADGFSLDDIIQGSIITKFAETDLGGGSYQIDISTVPMEWDFHGDEAGLDHGGTCIDPVCYDNVRFDTRITVNWQGNVGVHRIDTTVQVPGQPAAAWDASIASRLDLGVGGLVFGFDEFIAYRNEGAKYSVLDEVIVNTGLSAPTLSPAGEADGVDDVVTVTFAAGQGRQVGTLESITVSGATPSSINGLQMMLWTSTTVGVFTVTGSGTNTYTGVDINSDTTRWQSFSDAYIRTAYKDRLNIAEGLAAKYTGDDQEGENPNHGLSVWATGPFGRNALVCRATGVAGYSLDDDFAVGLYAGRVSEIAEASAAGDAGIFQWQSVRDASAPAGTETEMPMLNMWHGRFWAGGTAQMPTGQYTNTVYILTGAYAGSVQTSITTLDALTDAVTGLNG